MPIARADIKFGLYTDFLDRTLSAEDERLPGESIEDGVIRVHDALERAAAILKKRVQESNTEEGIKFEYPAARPNPPVAPGGHAFRESTPQVIDLKELRLKESIEDMILECNTLEELSALKQSAGANGLVTQYMKRLNELMVK